MEKPFLSNILFERKNIIQILLIAVILTLGINLISSSIIPLFNISNINTFIVGLSFLIISVLYLFIKINWERRKISFIEGFFAFDPSNNKIIEVPRYQISGDMYNYITAAFAENKAYKILWDSQPLRKSPKPDETINKIKDDNSPRQYIITKVERKEEDHNGHSHQLIREVIEFCLFEIINSSLLDYFDHHNIDKSNLMTLDRNNIPQSILKNRFIELITRDRHEREYFVDDAIKNKQNIEGKVFAVFTETEGGFCIFDLLEITLPKGSTISRNKNNNIVIKTNRFSIELFVGFNGMSSSLPEGFVEYYLDQDFLLIDTFEFIIGIKVDFSLKSLFSITKWPYYNWIDLVLEKIEEDISMHKFFERIGWEQTYTMIECQTIKEKKQKKEKSLTESGKSDISPEQVN